MHLPLTLIVVLSLLLANAGHAAELFGPASGTRVSLGIPLPPGMDGGSLASMVDADPTTYWQSPPGLPAPYILHFKRTKAATPTRIELDARQIPAETSPPASFSFQARTSSGYQTLVSGILSEKGRQFFDIPIPRSATDFQLLVLQTQQTGKALAINEVRAWADEVEAAQETVLPLLPDEPSATPANNTGADTDISNSSTVPSRWKGKIQVIQHGPVLHGSGKLETRWTLQVNWKEQRRIDVVNDQNQTIGQFVLLEDDDSSWQGMTQGNIADREKCYRSTESHFASGSGSQTLSLGWIYFSLSDEDPLASWLPNGRYALHAAADQRIQGDIRRQAIDPCYKTLLQFSQENQALLGFSIGRAYTNPLPDGPDRISASALLKTFQASQRQPARAMDTQIRTLKNQRMQGRYRSEGAARGDSLYWEVEWDISMQQDADIVLEAIPRQWRPHLRDPLMVRGYIRSPADAEGLFRFTLYEVSREKGDAMNHGDNTEPDLRFDDLQAGFSTPESTTDGYRTTSTDPLREAEVAIRAEDYGGWGKLKLEVQINGQWYTARTATGEPYNTLPVDENENRIADYWEEQHGIQDALADEDEHPSQPMGREPGDGLSAYEEYRGFYIQGIWQSTDPKRKDIFIYNPDALNTSAFVQSLPSWNIHDNILEEEFDGIGSRVVNFNRSSERSLGPQLGLYLHIGDPGDSLAPNLVTSGRVVPTVGTPNTVQEIIVTANAGRSTIAHELGHALNVMHHSMDLGELGHCNSLETEEIVIARHGDVTSGDVTCFMRYSFYATAYRDTQGKCKPYPDDLLGTHFCPTPKATSFNAPPLSVAGDAQIGACLQKLTIKGNRTWGN